MLEKNRLKEVIENLKKDKNFKRELRTYKYNDFKSTVKNITPAVLMLGSVGLGLVAGISSGTDVFEGIREAGVNQVNPILNTIISAGISAGVGVTFASVIGGITGTVSAAIGDSIKESADESENHAQFYKARVEEKIVNSYMNSLKNDLQNCEATNLKNVERIFWKGFDVKSVVKGDFSSLEENEKQVLEDLEEDSLESKIIAYAKENGVSYDNAKQSVLDFEIHKIIVESNMQNQVKENSLNQEVKQTEENEVDDFVNSQISMNSYDCEILDCDDFDCDCDGNEM